MLHCVRGCPRTRPTGSSMVIRGLPWAMVLRNLEAIAPGSTLLELLSEKAPALLALNARDKSKRLRDMSLAEREELDF